MQLATSTNTFKRLRFVRLGFLVAGIIVTAQLFRIQVLSRGFYTALADGQHELFQHLFPERGRIYASDPKTGQVSLVAANRSSSLAYAEPFHVKEPKHAAYVLAPLLGLDEIELAAKLADSKAQYRPLKKDVPDDVRAKIEALKLDGIAFSDEDARFYPEGDTGAQVLGFVSSRDDGSRVGHYGIEGYFNQELSGATGFLNADKDPFGHLLADSLRQFKPAKNGTDIVLTIDRTVEHVVCSKLQAWVSAHGAARGSVVIMDPNSGAVVAMCNAPSFDPNAFNKVDDVGVYNNTAIFDAYEPGSIFKTITMAAGLDTGKITPDSTFNDTGEEKIGQFTIHNADRKGHGIVSMTEILAQSLNTGIDHVVQMVGSESFLSYVQNFGFGVKTGIELETESPGNIESLKRKGDIWAATGAFGQGLTVTPIQMAAAYASIANGGTLLQPTIVAEMRDPSTGQAQKTKPKVVRRVMSERAARLLTGMLVAVVEKGEGHRAGIQGYWVGGKTGTAQIPRTDGQTGYEVGSTIGSFAGFAPIDNPKFVMIVRIDRPKDVQYAESSAAPLWGAIGKFLTDYYEIPPTRH